MNVFDLFAKLSLDTSDYEKSLDVAGKESTSFMDKLGGGMKAMKAAVTTVGTKIVDASGKVAEYGDNIDKMSQKMGISAEAYQEWDAIMQHSGTSIEALKPSMKILATQAEKGSDAFAKLGISQEEVANLSQEELFAKVISELQQMEEGSERTYITSQLLGRGAIELGALLNTSAEDTEKMRQRVHELGGVMSNEAVKAAAAYQDSLQDMQTAIDSITRNAVSNFLPSITSVMDGIANIFSGDKDLGLTQMKDGIDSLIATISDGIPKVIEIGGEIIGALGQSIMDNLPNILSSGVEIITTLTTQLIESLPTFVDAALQIILAISTGLSDAYPELIPTIVDVVLQIVETLIDNVDMLIDASIAIILGLANGLISAMPRLLEKAPTIVQKLVTTLVDNAPKLVDAALQLIMALTNFLVDPQNIDLIIDTTITVLMTIINALIDNAPEMVDAALEIIGALAAGLLMFVGNLTEKAQELIDELKKSFDGQEIMNTLHDVGRGIIDRIAKGIADTILIAKDWAKDLIKNFVAGLAENGGDLKQAAIDFLANPIKNVIGFSEPKEGPLSDFHTYAPDMIDLFTKGIKDNENELKTQVKKTFDFGDLSSGFNIADAEKELTNGISADVSYNLRGNRPSVVQGAPVQAAKNTPTVIQLVINDHEIAKAILPALTDEKVRLGTRLAT